MKNRVPFHFQETEPDDKNNTYVKTTEMETAVGKVTRFEQKVNGVSPTFPELENTFSTQNMYLHKVAVKGYGLVEIEVQGGRTFPKKNRTTGQNIASFMTVTTEAATKVAGKVIDGLADLASVRLLL